MDIVHDVFSEALAAHSQIFSRGEPGGLAWLQAIARRRLADRIRYWYAREREAVRRVELPDGLEYQAEWVSPLDRLAAAEESSDLNRALARIPPVQREALLAQWIEGRSTEDTARALGRSVNAIRLLRCRGLRKLRALMDPHPGAPNEESFAALEEE